MIEEQKIIAVPSDQLLPMQCCPHVPSKCCSKCGVEKPLSEFYKNGERLHTKCKLCHNEVIKEYRESNKDIIKERKKLYRLNNREKENNRIKRWVNETGYNKKRWEKEKDTHKKRRQDSYGRNKEKRLAESKDWSNKNRDRSNAIKKEYCIKNPDKIRELTKKSQKRWREELHPLYVKSIATKSRGFSKSQIEQNPEILNVIQLIIKTKRLCKTLQS